MTVEVLGVRPFSAGRMPSHRFLSSRRLLLTQARAAVLENSQIQTVSQDGKDVAVSGAPQKDKGSLMFSVPNEQWLHAAACAESDIGGALEGQPEWVQIALYLVYAAEQRLPTWSDCLENMQGSTTKPIVLWSDEQLRELEGTQVLQIAMDYRSFFAAKYQELQQSVLPKLPAAVTERCTQDVFITAAATVRARLIPPFSTKEPCLVPGLELVQHRRKANVELVMKSSGFMGRSKALQVVSTAPLATEEPLFVDYGPDCLESQIALDHGAYDGESGRPGYLLTLELPEEEAEPLYYDKLDILELQGLQAQQSFTLQARSQPPDEMLGYLRLLNVKGPDAFLMEPVFRNEAWGFMMEPVSEENEEAVCRSMMAGCEAALRSYPTSVADDLAKLRDLDDGAAWCLRTALQLRTAEKEILEDTSAWFSQRLKDLENLEYYQERRLKRLGLLDDNGESTFEDMIKINV